MAEQYTPDTTPEPHTPTDLDAQTALVDFLTGDTIINRHPLREAQAIVSRWLAAHDARVRRDAARGALKQFRKTELALIPPDADEDDPIRVRQQALAWRIEMHLLAHYPETED